RNPHYRHRGTGEGARGAKRAGLRRGRGGNGEPRQEHREEPQMKSARRRSRELALQGLYAWQLAGDNAADLQSQLAESKGFGKADAKYFARLLQGTIADAAALERLVRPVLGRTLKQLH